MDRFGIFSKTDVKSKSSSVSPSPSRHKKKSKPKSKKRFTQSSASKKTIFESSSSDEHTYSSYTSRNSRSHLNQTESSSNSSSDLDVAQLDDFKPLLSSKNKNQNRNISSSNRNQNAKMNINKPQRLEFRSKTTGNLNDMTSQNGKSNNFRNTVNNKFNATSNNINDFRNEINSIKNMNREYGASQSENNLFSQIQEEHKEQDEVLGDMSTVLERLQIMSQDIGNEIVDQDELLKETTEQADTTYDKMKRVERKMDELIRENGLTPCKVIGFLSCTAIVLLLLVIWT
eukprot:CAMPEP_0201572640 /NCGR_PEP_ID=MMETSP0190_2-20130828/16037_1 /ASSEMBLY_ACC=CAM_ASM_000263 /TAXON_ID=37353 /ORGANISM="Rosalina sp." /LENGTH=286 /DNA_ID=CAMNT_0047998669 /DNA_START=11 /DNA_END=871 /DNA_ORIENTATION=-